VETLSYRLIEKPERVIAVDENGVEICGARRPYGHADWIVYTTVRLTKSNHQVLATTKDVAEQHVKLLAELFTREQAK
jgi:hypothetical protein